MINKKIASEIAVGIILLLAIVVGGIFWMQSKKEVAVIDEVQKPIQKEATACTQDAKLCEDGKTYVSRTGPKCEFADCSEQSVVKAGYKMISINNPLVNFSFEVPEKWLVETRNSGDRKLNIEEMRKFLVNYGIILFEAEKVSSTDVKEEFLAHDFPVASVSGNDHIWYTDWNDKQVDFRIMSSSETQKEILNIKSLQKQYNYNDVWMEDEVAGFNAQIVRHDPSINSDGKKEYSPYSSGGSEYFIKINDSITLYVVSQAASDDQFKLNFDGLIKGLQIKAL